MPVMAPNAGRQRTSAMSPVFIGGEEVLISLQGREPEAVVAGNSNCPLARQYPG